MASSTSDSKAPAVGKIYIYINIYKMILDVIVCLYLMCPIIRGPHRMTTELKRWERGLKSVVDWTGGAISGRGRSPGADWTNPTNSNNGPISPRRVRRQTRRRFRLISGRVWSFIISGINHKNQHSGRRQTWNTEIGFHRRIAIRVDGHQIRPRFIQVLD